MYYLQPGCEVLVKLCNCGKRLKDRKKNHVIFVQAAYKNPWLCFIVDIWHHIRQHQSSEQMTHSDMFIFVMLQSDKIQTALSRLPHSDKLLCMYNCIKIKKKYCSHIDVSRLFWYLTMTEVELRFFNLSRSSLRFSPPSRICGRLIWLDTMWVNTVVYLIRSHGWRCISEEKTWGTRGCCRAQRQDCVKMQIPERKSKKKTKKKT